MFGGKMLLRDWLGIDWRVVSNCFHLHHLSFIGFFSQYVIFPPNLLLLFYLFFNVITLFFTLPILAPILWWWGRSERAALYCLVASWG